MAPEPATLALPSPTVQRMLHVFPTFDAGGPQVRTARLIEALGDGWHHRIVSLDGCVGAGALLPDAAASIVLPMLPRAGSLPTVARLRLLLTRERPDLVATYNWGAIDAALAAAIARIPFLHHEETVADDETGMVALRRDLARRFVLRRAHALVVPSRQLATKAAGRWIATARLHLVPNGIDVARRLPRDGRPTLRRQLGIAADDLLVGCIGHLRPEKGIARLLVAFAQLRTPRTRLLVVGDGSERTTAESRARSLGVTDRVSFVGHLDDPGDHFRALDVFALPSHREQMPIALLEAMAHALPVVAVDVGEVAAMLPSSQHAHLVAAADDGTGMARQLDALLADPRSRAQLGATNRAFASERHSFAAMADRYRGLYRSGHPEGALARGAR